MVTRPILLWITLPLSLTTPLPSRALSRPSLPNGREKAEAAHAHAAGVVYPSTQVTIDRAARPKNRRTRSLT